MPHSPPSSASLSSSGISQRAQRAAGQPISEMMSLALARPDLISLAAGFVDQQTLPVKETRIATEAILSDPNYARVALQYGTTAGYQPLREAILDRLCTADGRSLDECGTTIDQVVITAGSNQLLHLLVESICNPGDAICCSAPTYFVFLGLLSNLGVHAIGIDFDEYGMIPESLEDYLTGAKAAGELHRVKAIYLVSYFQNPSGISLAIERRAKIVEIAKRFSSDPSVSHRIQVLEDAAYRELRYSGDDLPSVRSFDDDGTTVVYAGTFSKSYSPGLRVGWGILPKHLVAPVCDQKGNFDFGSPHFSQCLIAKIIELGLFQPHVEALQQSYCVKMQAMLAAADEFFAAMDGVHWFQPTGGLYVWLILPEHLDTGPTGQLFDLAQNRGVLYVPGQYCFPSEGVAVKRNTIRLSFGVQSPENIHQGMQLLSQAVAELI